MHESRSMQTLSVEEIRGLILARFQHQPRVSISVQMPHSRLAQSSQVVITGVYPHIFCVEERIGDAVQRHAFQYVDVLTRRVEIEGL